MDLVTIGSASDVGMRRKENQDYHAYYSSEDNGPPEKGILLALADGMGGRIGGAVASKTAIDVLMQEYYKDDSQSIPESLKVGFLKANEEVLTRGQEDIELQGMGTTLTAVVLKENKMYCAHIGDSRGYIIFKNKMTQFTEDDSYVAKLIKAGYITEEEALTHPERNAITKAIGIGTELEVEVPDEYQKLKKGQYILLCCDGLYRVVSDEEIISTINTLQEPDVICERLVERANEEGGPDNITVILARIDRTSIKPGLISRFIKLMR